MSASLNHPRRLPGWEGVWVFIAADMMVFGLLFASFVIERGKNVDLFNLSRKALNFNYGGINTLILLTSSWFVVLAVQAVKANKLRQVPHFLALGVLCGTTFGMLKIVEYTEKLSAGISPPVTLSIGLLSSFPTQTPTTISGVKPMNHASLLCCDVPVFPALGMLSRAALPVPP